MNFFGIILATVALFFVFEKIWNNRSWIVTWHPTKDMVLTCVTASIIYALSCFLLSTAWQRLLIWLGGATIGHRACHAVYGRTQVAKYIPGNIFHIAGRHIWARQLGFEHGTLAGAAVYEILGLLLASSTIALMSLILWRTSGNIPIFSIAIIFSITLLSPFILNKAISSFPKFRHFGLQRKDLMSIVKGLLPICSLYFLYFFIVGGILLWLVNDMSPVETFGKAGAIISIVAVSWIVGFISPGSPGGLGIREAMLIFFLSGLIGEPESTLVAVVFRLITVSGDFLFWLVSYIIAR